MQAIVLAAGKGKRMKSKTINKVLFPLAGQPMIGYIIGTLKKLGIKNIIVVVGFKKEKVIKFLGDSVSYVEQRKKLGTANAVFAATKIINKNDPNVLILNADDSAFYTTEILRKLINVYLAKKADIGILTVIVKKAEGFGRVIRSREGRIIGIVEEKKVSSRQRKIKEVNTGCYVVKRDILEKYLPKIKKSPVTNEYYFTDIVSIIAKGKGRIETLNISPKFWRGINTLEEYKQADRAMRRRLSI